MTVAATDGSCWPNPGPGGWGWYIDRDRNASGSAIETTNNIMELTAVRELLLAVDGPLYIYTDSQYVLGWLTEWHKTWAAKNWTRKGKPVKNRKLIQEILGLMVGRHIEFEWVRGHQGFLLNELADALAERGREDAYSEIALQMGDVLQ